MPDRVLPVETIGRGWWSHQAQTLVGSGPRILGWPLVVGRALNHPEGEERHGVRVCVR
jgi:hypothetical protein